MFAGGRGLLGTASYLFVYLLVKEVAREQESRKLLWGEVEATPQTMGTYPPEGTRQAVKPRLCRGSPPSDTRLFVLTSWPRGVLALPRKQEWTKQKVPMSLGLFVCFPNKMLFTDFYSHLPDLVLFPSFVEGGTEGGSQCPDIAQFQKQL